MLQQADPEIRRVVEDLLVHSEAVDGPLDRPAWQSGSQDDEAAPRLLPGEPLGPYVIDAEIGVGGIGRVFRASDERLNRVVAIKVLAAQFSSRFELESNAIAALNHPNICQIYDVGPSYLVMEYVEGLPVVVPRQQPMPVSKILQLSMQIVSAIEAAHLRGIVHRI